jgi:prepilin-type N-terminal cleavage/methylation domain-containing protein
MDGPIEVSRFPRPARGFTLIEIVVVLFILGVAISMAAAITSALTASQRLSTTTARMQAIDAAIVQFVMQQKRLPCPADGRTASGQASAGVEQRSNTGHCNIAGVADNVQHGVVPWVSLGLSESDATDGWNRRFTYRIQPALAADASLDATACDPMATVVPLSSTTSCAGGCPSTNSALCTSPYNFVYGKGLEVRNFDGTSKLMDPSPTVATTPPTGAAYVVISSGPTGGGAYLGSGELATSTTTDSTPLGEAKNYANVGYAAGTTYYVDAAISEGSGTSTHFDDIVSRPALLTVINKAGLAPRSH